MALFPNIPLSSFFFPMPRARPRTAGQQGRRAGPSLQGKAGQGRAGRAACCLGYFEVEGARARLKKTQIKLETAHRPVRATIGTLDTETIRSQP